jgi:hypothetical protein
VTGVLATHYHPDHVGGSMMNYKIEGIAALLERTDCPIHVQRDEVPWVRRTTGVGDDHLAAHDAGDVVEVGSIAITLVHTPGPHSRQPVLPRRRATGQRRHPVPRRLRPHRPARQQSGRDVLQPAETGGDADRHDRLPRATGTRTRRTRRCSPILDSNYVFRPRSAEQWLQMFGG